MLFIILEEMFEFKSWLVFSLKLNRIHRAALWILGEYCTTAEDIQSVMTLIRQALGEVSINFYAILTF